MKNLLAILPILTILVLFGCSVQQEPKTADPIVSGVVQGGEKNADDGTKETPSLDAISWETYTNDEYGFSVEHPDNFTISETSEELGDTVDQIGITFNCLEGDDRCRSYGMVVNPHGRWQEQLYESAPGYIFDFADTEGLVQIDTSSDTPRLFGSILKGNGNECNLKEEIIRRVNHSGLRIKDVPSQWSVQLNFIGVHCTDKSQAPVLKKMLESFTFL